MKKGLVLIVLLFVGKSYAGDEEAVVCIPSHGGSGVVIGTNDKCTYILSCWHCFSDSKSQKKPIRIDVPGTGQQRAVGIDLLAVGDDRVDLALIRVNCGPFKKVLPINPRNRPIGRDCWSMGFDSMKYPATQKQTRIMKSYDTMFWTNTPPWHGRSGGALISDGYLVGICHAYSGQNGIYVNHKTIYNFLIQQKAIAESPMTQEAGFRDQQIQIEIQRQFQYQGPSPEGKRPKGC